MSEIAILVTSGFLLGALGALLFLLHVILRGNAHRLNLAVEECVRLEEKLEGKVLEFDTITRKASEANLTIAERVIANDKKLNDIENRIAMLKMQR